MFTGTPAPAIIDRVRAEKLVRGTGFHASDLEIVDEVLAAEHPDADPSASLFRLAAGALCEASGVLLAKDGEACDILGIPRDGRTTSFRIWRSTGPACTAAVGFSLDRIRSAAKADFALMPAGQERWHGIPLPPQVAWRLAAIADRPALAPHLLRSAADHMAAFVMGLVIELPGAAPQGRDAVWAASCPSGKIKDALAWLALPGPGLMADYVHAFVVEERQ